MVEFDKKIYTSFLNITREGQTETELDKKLQKICVPYGCMPLLMVSDWPAVYTHRLGTGIWNRRGQEGKLSERIRAG